MEFSSITSGLSVHQFTARRHARSETEVMTSFSRSVRPSVLLRHSWRAISETETEYMRARTTEKTAS